MNKIQSYDNTFPHPGQTPPIDKQGGKLTDYRDIRKERKMIKKKYDAPAGSNTSELTNFLNSESNTVKDKRSHLVKMRSACSTEQTSNVFDRLLTHSTITSRIKEKPPLIQGGDQNIIGRSGSFSYEFQDELNSITESQLLWNCDFSVENAHAHPIYSIATIENQLYT